jgi:hypothetical protein
MSDMNDISRVKYARLIAEIGDLEDRIEQLEKNPAAAPVAAAPRQALEELELQLALKRSELTRLSDGCGKPRST